MEGRKALILIMCAVVALSMFSSSVAAEGFLSEIFKTISDWFSMSPFGNVFQTQPEKGSEEVTITFFPESFMLSLENPVNITSNLTSIFNFKGELNVILTNQSKAMLLREKGSSLIVEQRIDTVVVKDVVIPEFELKNTKLVLVTGNWTETSESGVLKIYSFMGTMTVKKNLIEMKGNITRFEKV
jgi:hypothetical protein